MENVMNKIGKQAVKTYRQAAEVTGKLTKEIKLKTLMAQNKSKIQEIYEEIGESVYEKYLLKEKIEIEEELKNHCSMIDILASEIEDIRMELLKLKDRKQCLNCHYEIYYDFHYCPNCGFSQEEQEENQKDEKNVTIETTDEDDSFLSKMQQEDEMEIEESDERYDVEEEDIEELEEDE